VFFFSTAYTILKCKTSQKVLYGSLAFIGLKSKIVWSFKSFSKTINNKIYVFRTSKFVHNNFIQFAFITASAFKSKITIIATFLFIHTIYVTEIPIRCYIFET